MNTDLINAVQAGDVPAVLNLLNAGGNVNSRDAQGETLLMLASTLGSLPLIRVLINAGADVNSVNESGWSALTRALYNPNLKRGYPEVVEALIDAGANIEASIGYGVRPLMLAAGYGETASVELLIKSGADVLAKNEGGYTALMMVKQKHYVDVVNLLHEAEQLLGTGECSSKIAPDSQVITFLKRS